jgi:hypothetical protein
MAKKKRSKKRQMNSTRRLKVYPIYNTYNSTIHSTVNPFYKTYPTSSFTRAPSYNRFRFLYKLKKDSAVNPFRRFGKDRLGINKIKKKDLNWEQAKKRYPNMQPFGDADRDGVINMFDCKPFDPKRQDTKVGNAAKLRIKKPSKIITKAIKMQEKLKKLEEATGGKTDLQKALAKQKRFEEKLSEYNSS